MIEFTKCDKGFYPIPSETYINGNVILSSHTITIKPGEMYSINTGLIMRHQLNHYIKVIPTTYFEPLLDIINSEEHNSINPHNQFLIKVRNKVNNAIKIGRGTPVVEVIELHQQFGKIELITPTVVEESKQEEVVEESKQEEVVEETKQEEVVEETKQEEVVGESKQEEVVGETKQEEVVGETKQEEVVEGESKQEFDAIVYPKKRGRRRIIM